MSYCKFIVYIHRRRVCCGENSSYYACTYAVCGRRRRRRRRLRNKDELEVSASSYRVDECVYLWSAAAQDAREPPNLILTMSCGMRRKNVNYSFLVDISSEFRLKGYFNTLLQPCVEAVDRSRYSRPSSIYGLVFIFHVPYRSFVLSDNFNHLQDPHNI